jgi:hypothetical protein
VKELGQDAKRKKLASPHIPTPPKGSAGAATDGIVDLLQYFCCVVFDFEEFVQRRTSNQRILNVNKYNFKLHTNLNLFVLQNIKKVRVA